MRRSGVTCRWSVSTVSKSYSIQELQYSRAAVSKCYSIQVLQYPRATVSKSYSIQQLQYPRATVCNCLQEGIKLPSHYPLKKSEESLLKRIRRKIRNKRSAQTSRKKQKEYIDALEYRTDLLEADKAGLVEQVRGNRTIVLQSCTLSISPLGHRVGVGRRAMATAYVQVDELSRENASLVESVRKLQQTISNGTRRSAQASTCMAVGVL